MSRRQLMKRAGVVGAAVWAVPVIESMRAPAFATVSGTCVSSDPSGCGISPPCGALCAKDQACTMDQQCVAGTACTGTGGATGKCESVGGTTCKNNSDCQSNNCVAGVGGAKTCVSTVGKPCTPGATAACSGGTSSTCPITGLCA